MLGIIGCYGVSDQILHLINRDRSIDRVYVVDKPEGQRFVKKMEERSINKDVLLVSEDHPLERGQEGFSVFLWLNPEDLHNQPMAIQSRQDELLSRLSNKVDSILFCYGLCRSSEQRIKNLIKQAAKPVTFLTDDRGEIVDDCFGAVLGGKKIYLDTMLRNRGTLFATTGYAEAWDRRHQLMDIESMVHEVEQLKFMFEALGYHRIIRLDDGVGDPVSFEQKAQAFSRTFEMELVSMTCHLRVFERSYDLAKESMRTGKAIDVGEVPTAVASTSDPEANLSAWSLLGDMG